MQSRETQRCRTDPLPGLLKMPLPPPERRVDLWDDWWTNRQTDPLSVLRAVCSKIRSSIKIALWNLCALCQWSACSAVDISLPSSAYFLFASPLSSFPSSWCPPPSKLCLHLLSLESLFSALSPHSFFLSLPSVLGLLHSDLPRLCVMLIKVSFVIDVVYSGGAHACVSRQGWLWLSCPRALRAGRDRAWAEGSGRL